MAKKDEKNQWTWDETIKIFQPEQQRKSTGKKKKRWTETRGHVGI